MLKALDPRWVQFSNHSLLLLYGILFVNFNRPIEQILGAVLTCIICEAILFRIFNKSFKNVFGRLLSATITGLGLLLLVYSHTLQFYIALAVVAVLSKYLLRDSEGNHLFNPSCFAIVFAFAFFPNYQPIFHGDNFLYTVYPSLQVILLGGLVTFMANRWRVSLGFWSSLFLIAGVLHFFGIAHFVNTIGPELGVIGLLIAMFFITDPRTSPSDHKHQLYFGVAYGCFDVLFKQLAVYGGHFLALMIVMSLYQIHRNLKTFALRPKT